MWAFVRHVSSNIFTLEAALAASQSEVDEDTRDASTSDGITVGGRVSLNLSVFVCSMGEWNS